MSEYMGTDNMIALQKSLRNRTAEFAQNPLLSNGGRIMNILDPAQYGWAKVRSAAERDGLVGLTMVDQDRTLSRLASLFGEEVECPFWQAFTGKPEDVLPACAGVVTDFAVPEGWRVESHINPDDDTIHAAQVLNKDTGVAPTPAYYLRGDQVPSMLTCVYETKGTMVACASGTMRYHPAGPLSGWLFAGGVSVRPQHRRTGLGSLVNARLLVDSQYAYNWVRALEQAKADNAGSVGMITRCGLRPNDGKVTIIINLTGSYVTR